MAKILSTIRVIPETGNGTTRIINENDYDADKYDLAPEEIAAGRTEKQIDKKARQYRRQKASPDTVNVQADWNETNVAADAFILNKPTTRFLPAGGAAGQLLKKESAEDYDVEWSTEDGVGEMNVQADWGESSSSSDAFIRNKPTNQLLPRGGNTGHVLQKTGDGDFIASWATQTGEANVQVDWNEADTAADAFIQNKPTARLLPAGGAQGHVLTKDSATDYAASWGAQTGEANVQADWNESSTTADAFILNKPTDRLIPTGGTKKGVLRKSADTDYAVEWHTPPVEILNYEDAVTRDDWEEHAAWWDGDHWRLISRTLSRIHDGVFRFATIGADGFEVINRLGSANANNLALMRDTLDNGHESTAVQWVSSETVSWEIGDLVYETTNGDLYFCVTAHNTDATDHQPSAGSTYWAMHTPQRAPQPSRYKGVFRNREIAAETAGVNNNKWVIALDGGVPYPLKRQTNPSRWVWQDLGNVNLEPCVFDTNAAAAVHVREDETTYVVIADHLKKVTFYHSPAATHETFLPESPECLYSNILLDRGLGEPLASKIGHLQWHRGHLYECVPRFGTPQTVGWTTYAENADVSALWGESASTYRWRGNQDELADVNSPQANDVVELPTGQFFYYKGTSGWRYLREPDNYLGDFTNESLTNHHVRKVGQVATVNNVLQSVSTFTAGSDPYYLWVPAL